MSWLKGIFGDENTDALKRAEPIVARVNALEDGMRVRVYGRPGIYAKSGRLSMNVEWAEPAGEGALKRAFELLKAELEKAGFTPGTMTDKLSLDLAMDGMNDTLIQADSPEQALQIIEHTMFHLWQSARIKEILN